MPTSGLLSSLLLAALGVTAAAFALYDHFAPLSANAHLSASATAAAPSLPPAVRSRNRFVLVDARPSGAAVGTKAAAKPHAKALVKAVDKSVDKDKRRPPSQNAALPWPFSLMQ